MSITVIVVGDPKDEHYTIIEHNNSYYSFYTDGYDYGTTCNNIISFLKFLGYDVFEVYKKNGTKLIRPINQDDICDDVKI